MAVGGVQSGHGRGAAARRRRSLIARPRPCSGTGITAIRSSPSAAASSSSFAQTGEQARRSLDQIGGVAQVEHRTGTRQRRTESQQRLIMLHIHRIEPHRQLRRIVRREQAGRSQRAWRRRAIAVRAPGRSLLRSPRSSRHPAAATRARHLKDRAQSIPRRPGKVRCRALRRCARTTRPARAARVVGTHLAGAVRRWRGDRAARSPAAAPAPCRAPERVPPVYPAPRWPAG